MSPLQRSEQGAEKVTRTQMRTILRRRLNEVTADQWQDADLNDLINHAYQRMEMDILSVNPDAFISTYRADIVLNQQLYEKPAGFNYETAFKILDTGTSTYKRVDLVDYHVGLDRTGDQEGTKYSHFGSYFFLSPKPGQNLAAGIELDFVPTLSMTADTDVPKVALPLHMGIIHHAAIMAFGETGEDVKRELELLSTIVNKIPAYYLKTSAGQAFTPDISKGY